MAEIKNFADVVQQTEQMRNEILSANFTSIKDKISGIELQSNNRFNDLKKVILTIEKKASKRNKVLIYIMIAASVLILVLIYWEKFV